jgi:hypothetical protein
VALIAPFVMGMSYFFPVRLSMIVNVSAAMAFTFRFLASVVSL